MAWVACLQAVLQSQQEETAAEKRRLEQELAGVQAPLKVKVRSASKVTRSENHQTTVTDT